MNKNLEKILKEYDAKISLYKEFTNATNFLLESILKKGSYKYHIYSRLKQVESLKEKIERKSSKGKIYKSLKDITDIAGIRVIFYTENDRRKFISKMQKEFKDSLKIKETYKVSGYRAVHTVLSLDKERLKLSEYGTFDGLECEVQLCLMLEHAWAEIEHDILYKENWGFRENDKIHYLYMKEQMQEIMTNYISKASTELENMVTKFKKMERNNTRAKPSPSLIKLSTPLLPTLVE